jgi:hypothetical protein
MGATVLLRLFLVLQLPMQVVVAAQEIPQVVQVAQAVVGMANLAPQAEMLAQPIQAVAGVGLEMIRMGHQRPAALAALA